MGPALPAPFRCGPFAVRPEWIDENAHLNLAYYVMLFDWATDALWPLLGLGDELRATGRGTFVAETHTLYRAELVEGETVSIATQLLDCDDKRLHLAHEMRRDRDGAVSALQQLMFLSVDLTARRVAPWPDAIQANLREAVAAHAALARPDWLGRRVAMKP
jgi:acyl-CoA thioester hydrolase